MLTSWICEEDADAVSVKLWQRYGGSTSVFTLGSVRLGSVRFVRHDP